MPRGIRRGEFPDNDLTRDAVVHRYTIGRSTDTGSERVGYHLTGGRGPDATHHGAQRFGTHEAAMAYMEKNRLEYDTPEPSLPPSDAGDVGWAGRKKR